MYFNFDTKNILDFSVKIQGFVFHFWRENSKLKSQFLDKKLILLQCVRQNFQIEYLVGKWVKLDKDFFYTNKCMYFFFFKNLLVLVDLGPKLGPPYPQPHSASAIPMGPWSKNKLQKSVQFLVEKIQNFFKDLCYLFFHPQGASAML